MALEGTYKTLHPLPYNEYFSHVDFMDVLRQARDSKKKCVFGLMRYIMCAFVEVKGLKIIRVSPDEYRIQCTGGYDDNGAVVPSVEIVEGPVGAPVGCSPQELSDVMPHARCENDTLIFDPDAQVSSSLLTALETMKTAAHAAGVNVNTRWLVFDGIYETQAEVGVVVTPAYYEEDPQVANNKNENQAWPIALNYRDVIRSASSLLDLSKDAKPLSALPELLEDTGAKYVSLVHMSEAPWANAFFFGVPTFEQMRDRVGISLAQPYSNVNSSMSYVYGADIASRCALDAFINKEVVRGEKNVRISFVPFPVESGVEDGYFVVVWTCQERKVND
ncbi:MAG: hypothetical protein J6M18_00035 [Actinomycetaceae bacterium]|nr:hypothetical protein [Actinomycetaceae bacterium]